MDSPSVARAAYGTRPVLPDARRLYAAAAMVVAMGLTIGAHTGVTGEAAVPAASAGDAAVDRVLARLNGPALQYRAVRRMRAASEKLQAEGWLDARTEFDGRVFNYQVLADGGSARIRSKALRPILQGEAEAVKNDRLSRVALTRANYSFAPEYSGA